jgi:hypothetical protein
VSLRVQKQRIKMKAVNLRAAPALREKGREQYGRVTVACAPEKIPARRDRREKSEPQDAAGEAAGLSGAAGLAMSLAAGLASGEAAAGLASAEASGAGVSSDLVQAVAAKTIEKRARIRNFRITTS